MPTTFDRAEFVPPPQPGLMRGLVMALAAHGLLVAALTWGLQWNRERPELTTAAAELWSATPQEAAPPAPVVVPPPPPQPPVVRAPPLPEPPVQRQADIAVEREKDRKQEAERREREEEARKVAEKKRAEERERKQEQEKLAAEQRKQEADKRRRLQEQQEKKLAELRDDNMRRMQSMAGGGSNASTGSAAQSSGPSASWAGRVRARVRPNIVFTDEVSGNPQAEVEVRMAPDGTIVGTRLVKPSGVKAWDDAVLRALEKTEMLPRDVDGRVHSPIVIAFRRHD